MSLGNRLKYFVEDSELRALRCGAFAAGRRVLLLSQGAEAPVGSVEAFDEESDSYTVRLLDGRMRFYVMVDEMKEIR